MSFPSPPSAVPRHVFKFGLFELDVLDERLTRNGEPISLAPKTFQLLQLLVSTPGLLLHRTDLIKQLWPDTFVEEANLTQHIFMLRKVLGERKDGTPYIATVARRGYRFEPDVEEVVQAPTERLSVPPWRSRITSRVRLWALPAALVGTAVVILQGNATETGTKRQLRVAVLPFRALAGGDTSEYLALGMADAVITRLAALKNLHVTSTSSVVKYANTTDPLSAGRELRVGAVVDGRFQLAGDRIRVTVQLLDVEKGRSLWANTFDESFHDVFAAQDAIAGRVADALMADLSAREREVLATRHTESTAAYQLYARGRYFWERRKPDALLKSIDYYQKAIALDPRYALAYAGLADSYNFLGTYSVLPPEEAFTRAKDAASKALDIDPRLAQAATAYAYATYLYDRDWDEAETRFKDALALAPNYAPGHVWYAVGLVSRGRFDEAVGEIQRAVDADPSSVTINSGAAWILYLARRHTGAIAAAMQTREMDSTFTFPHAYLGLVHLAEDRYAEAEVEFRKALDATGWAAAAHLGILGQILAFKGDSSGAQQVLRRLRATKYHAGAKAHAEALVRIGLGEVDQAFKLLEQSIDLRYPWAVQYNIDPTLDAVRADPRFAVLLRRIPVPEVPLPVPR
jgi:TolB-like protein/DNA-binding winged helix-turn-helix (wHTH) protein/Tfp pilus assembly protein PilF